MKVHIEVAKLQEAAKTSPEAKKALKVLCPEAFKDEPQILVKDPNCLGSDVVVTSSDYHGYPFFLSNLSGSWDPKSYDCIRVGSEFRAEVRQESGYTRIAFFKK